MKHNIHIIRIQELILLIIFQFILIGHSIAQWFPTNGPHAEVTYALAYGIKSTGDTIIYAGTYSGGLFCSSDFGATWSTLSRLYGFAGDTGFTRRDIRALAAIPNAAGGISLFAGTDGGGIFFSQNADTIWTSVNTGLINTSVFAIVINTNANGDTILYALTGKGVFLSINKGTSWASSNTELKGYYGFAVSHKSNGDTILYKLANKYIYYSNDNGTTWNICLEFPSYLTPNCLAVRDTILYVGHSRGVAYSLDYGQHWSLSGGRTTNTLLACGPYLFAGISEIGTQNSVWRRALSEMLTEVKKVHVQPPSSISLYQNYPNPFNPATSISFSLTSASFVSLKIFDLLGREVALILSENMGAGMHTINWNASKLSCGVYYYQLQVGSSILSKQLLLLK